MDTVESIVSTSSELHCKTVASAFWTYQVEKELRERNELDFRTDIKFRGYEISFIVKIILRN